MSLKKKLFSGSAIRLTHLFLEIVVGFLLMPYLVSELTEKWYGLWLLVASITGFFALLTLGLSSAVQRFLSYEISKKSFSAYKETISSSLFVFFITAVVVIVLAYSIGSFTEYFVEDTKLKAIFSSLVIIIGFNFAMRFFATPFNAALTAEFHFTLVSVFEILGFLIKSALTVYFVEKGDGVMGMGYALLIGEVFANASIAMLAIFKLSNFRFSISSIKKDKVIGLYEYGLNAFIATLGTMLRFPLGNIVISSFVGLASVTVYSIPVRLLSYADAFINTTLGVLQPYFTKLYAQGDMDALRKHFFTSCSLSLGLGGLLAGCLFVFGADFINFWVSEYPETRMLTYILPITLLLGICQKPSIMVLYALGKHRYYAYLNIAEVLVNIVIASVLINFIGIVGVALAVVIPMVYAKGWLLPKYVCKKLSVPLRDYFLLLGKCYFFVFTYSVLWILLAIEIADWYDLILFGSLYSLGFILLYLIGIINKNEQAMVMSFIKKITNR